MILTTDGFADDDKRLTEAELKLYIMTNIVCVVVGGRLSSCLSWTGHCCVDWRPLDCYWHYPHCMRIRLYKTVRCPSVCLSQHGSTAGAVGPAGRRCRSIAAAAAGSATLSAHVGSWKWGLILASTHAVREGVLYWRRVFVVDGVCS